ncbi:TolC family protein [Desulfofustis limnaeus]|jgi:outer membrane protein TolC|uniref:Membrane protein n=1 Tax=Desulfofustis limnaeus TaxID=2740163 RepID=A0ABM7W9U2_9BACT|nr:TolC family protein [Desulfofustis limnaeus]MDX9896202.1 TolC family protein [Desulfofustis sp.]BDD87755.1 membrane protein [Desulfofustis limnaeus]
MSLCQTLSKALLLTGAMIFLLVHPLAAASPPTTWSAREAVIFALRNSPDSRIAEQRIEAARAARQQADAVFRPQVSLGAGYSQTDNPMLAFGSILNQGGFNPGLDFNDPGRTDNLGVQAEVRYRFYNGGRDQARSEALEALLQASHNDRTAAWHRLGAEVIRSYQTIVLAQEQLSARQAELESITASLDVASARYQAGDMLRADLLHFEVQQARASEQLIVASHQLELAKKIFLNLLGLPETPVHLTPQQSDEQLPPEPATYRQRPEILTLSAKIMAAEAELTAARGALHPTLDGFAGYHYDRGWETGGDGSSWIAGVQLQYDLYDGGRRTGNIAQKTAQLTELKEHLTKLELAVNLQIQEALLNQRQAAEQRRVTDKMVQLARESAQLNRERFQQGVILVSDLIDSEVRLTDALVRQSAARTNCRTAVALLRQAVGLQQFAPTTEELLESQP